MSTQMENRLGIDEEKLENLTTSLNQLLADFQIYYQNLRGFHWNITGKQFFELHLKFEELYVEALTRIDEIAERILTISGRPLHSFSAYVEASEVDEVKDCSDGDDAMQHVIDQIQILLKQERHILNVASIAGDEGTVALMSDYIKTQEKQLWMFTSYMA